MPSQRTAQAPGLAPSFSETVAPGTACIVVASSGPPEGGRYADLVHLKVDATRAGGAGEPFPQEPPGRRIDRDEHERRYGAQGHERRGEHPGERARTAVECAVRCERDGRVGGAHREIARRRESPQRLEPAVDFNPSGADRLEIVKASAER